MNAIVVVDQNWAIGREGRLLFSLPTDMRRFRTLTTGGTVLLGRKTLESFPGGRPLPKRRNLVLTSGERTIEGAEVFHSLPEMLKAADQDDPERVFVIGGGIVYESLLPYCQRVYLTRVDAAVRGADTYFPNLDSLPEWHAVSTGKPIAENGLTYRFVEYVRREE